MTQQKGVWALGGRVSATWCQGGACFGENKPSHADDKAPLIIYTSSSAWDCFCNIWSKELLATQNQSDDSFPLAHSE